ncbi:MAG: hypothetical protein EBU88_07740, partial [Acidobacteria bacterium]|nr:hypothetical protein [Acidobacteriota bacterium]
MLKVLHTRGKIHQASFRLPHLLENVAKTSFAFVLGLFFHCERKVKHIYRLLCIEKLENIFIDTSVVVFLLTQR